jgi:hypothetical protein
MRFRFARARFGMLAVVAGCAAHTRATPSAHVTQQESASGAIVPPAQDYLALVASEAVDQIAVVRFGPGGIRVERTNTTGVLPADVVGPHGVAVSPDGKYY